MSSLRDGRPSQTKVVWFFLFLWSFAFGALGNQQELTPRGGLPWMVQKLGSPGSVKIAYLGGSITAADNGWRSKVTQWFQQNFPRTTFREINAGFSGTGGELGACRIQEHVLSQKPDLVVIEFAVNVAQLQSVGQVPKGIELGEKNVFYIGAVLLAGKLLP